MTHMSLKPSQAQSLFLLILVLVPLICIAMSDSAAKPLDSNANTSSSSAPAVHIVYTEKPQDEEPEAYHIRTLSAVLGRSVILSHNPVCFLRKSSQNSRFR